MVNIRGGKMKNRVFFILLFSFLFVIIVSLGSNVKATSKIQNVKVSLNGNKATITWDKLIDAEWNGEKVEVAGYTIMPYIEGKASKSYDVDSNDIIKYDYMELTDGKKYVFKV